MTEKEKMLAGLAYQAADKELRADHAMAFDLIFDYNNLHPKHIKQRKQLLRKLLGTVGTFFQIEQPFHCDYGYNIHLGENFFSNFNLTILDCNKVEIGNNVMFGPNVSLYTAGHPMHYQPRIAQHEWAKPITIGDNVWLGGNVVVNPGVSIGDNTVIGSGSIVTRSIPANVFAAGNPCRVIREITEEEKENLNP